MNDYTCNKQERKAKDKDTNPLTNRQRRLVFRASHRGIKEMDLILGNYVEQNIAKLSEEEIKELEYILSFEDRDLYSWIIGEIAIPEDMDTPLFRNILNFTIRTGS